MRSLLLRLPDSGPVLLVRGGLFVDRFQLADSKGGVLLLRQLPSPAPLLHHLKTLRVWLRRVHSHLLLWGELHQRGTEFSVPLVRVAARDQSLLEQHRHRLLPGALLALRLGLGLQRPPTVQLTLRGQISPLRRGDLPRA